MRFIIITDNPDYCLKCLNDAFSLKPFKVKAYLVNRPTPNIAEFDLVAEERCSIPICSIYKALPHLDRYKIRFVLG